MIAGINRIKSKYIPEQFGLISLTLFLVRVRRFLLLSVFCASAFISSGDGEMLAPITSVVFAAFIDGSRGSRTPIPFKQPRRPRRGFHIMYVELTIPLIITVYNEDVRRGVK